VEFEAFVHRHERILSENESSKHNHEDIDDGIDSVSVKEEEHDSFEERDRVMSILH
jgi:hypothetical protein